MSAPILAAAAVTSPGGTVHGLLIS